MNRVRVTHDRRTTGGTRWLFHQRFEATVGNRDVHTRTDRFMSTGTGCSLAFAVQYRQSEAIFIALYEQVKALPSTT